MDIHDLCGFIFSEVRTKLPRLQRSKQLSLSFEIACVASSIRSEFLSIFLAKLTVRPLPGQRVLSMCSLLQTPQISSMTFYSLFVPKRNTTAIQLLKTSPLYWIQLVATQFFVNMPLLIAKVDRTTQTPKYVSLNDPPAFCTSPDAIIPLLTLLIQNTTKLPTVVHLPEGLGPDQLGSLGWLLTGLSCHICAIECRTDDILAPCASRSNSPYLQRVESP
ncbi:hypothetical protein DL96DRAFT_181306 [Flagelloscypha sp. PMI_526]|nr:hypothetical protein DL96DRAFT_181306 [Flagelloscypha sp. PMI_526]